MNSKLLNCIKKNGVFNCYVTSIIEIKYGNYGKIDVYTVVNIKSSEICILKLNC